METTRDAIEGERATAAARGRIRDQLRHKLPEILLEAGSVVFAILLALGVDQWREERSHREMAQRARETIMKELRANRAELTETHKRNADVVVRLEAQIEQLRGEKARSLDTTMHLAQLSSAAFQASQSTQALQFIDFEWLVKVGRVYELQRTYTSAQDAALDEVSTSGGAMAAGGDKLLIMERIHSRLTTAQQLAGGLLGAYDKVIEK